MEWNEADKAYLNELAATIDNDNLKLKEKIKQILLDNKYIIHLLNNDELEAAEAEADEYFGKNILPFYTITPTQTNVQNFICFETQWEGLDEYNVAEKSQEVIFYILCNDKNNLDEDTGLPRHDLLAALVQSLFNYRNFQGGKLVLTSDKPGVVDSHYLSRTLIFSQHTDANLVKTVGKNTFYVNKGW